MGRYRTGYKSVKKHQDFVCWLSLVFRPIWQPVFLAKRFHCMPSSARMRTRQEWYVNSCLHNDLLFFADIPDITLMTSRRRIRSTFHIDQPQAFTSFKRDGKDVSALRLDFPALIPHLYQLARLSRRLPTRIEVDEHCRSINQTWGRSCDCEDARKAPGQWLVGPSHAQAGLNSRRFNTY